MTIWEVAGLIGVVLGVAGATVLFFSRPQYWVRVGLVVIAHFAPAVIAWLLEITKRMPPEEEAEWRKAVARGEGDEWIKARQRRKAKEYWEKRNGSGTGR